MMPSSSCAKNEILSQHPHHNLCCILLRLLSSMLKPDKSQALVCFLDQCSTLSPPSLPSLPPNTSFEVYFGVSEGGCQGWGSLTGTGRIRSELPARSAMCRYRGTSFSAAPALHTASETPRIALAPNLAVGKTKEELAFVGSNLLPSGCPCQPSFGVTTALTVPPTPALQSPVLFTSQAKKILRNYICSLCHPSQASGCLSSLDPQQRGPARKKELLRRVG